MAKTVELRVESAPGVEMLADIGRIRVFEFAADASSVLQSGGVLLAVAPAKDDRDGNPFRYVVGLRRDTELTPFLQQFFD